ncbi:DUF6186 family protein [Paeniglutamicibacter cryotolerans]|uniref:Uncharacterized protein n=1 Tax=Paeniglutamicibacter cryotolerans TaxID=670079 RepID=A0A839QNL8_9MICC|nr:DUF6186 family protein [Paeniglutamicibacter cryotolerans]MBB2994812.1 hypothetical protein [Paeniglutamicibacter cryotolerans]
MTREWAIVGYLAVPVVALLLFVLPAAWPRSWASPAELGAIVWENRAARMTLLLFCWWLGWHFLMPG